MASEQLLVVDVDKAHPHDRRDDRLVGLQSDFSRSDLSQSDFSQSDFSRSDPATRPYRRTHRDPSARRS
eukprot:2603444-Prymnesium_polylepis.1